MTPTEALNYLYEEASFGTLDNSKNTECLILLTSLVTPPTVDEVCEEIGKYFNGKVIYEKESKSFRAYSELGISCTVCSMNDDGTVTIACNFKSSPHTISIIARFYEGVE